VQQESMALDGFADSTFRHDGVSRTVYRRGSGPGVVILHETPGIHPDVARFATRVANSAKASRRSRSIRRAAIRGASSAPPIRC
jgi:hypothetical protein